jgi:hypothetical protein
MSEFRFSRRTLIGGGAAGAFGAATLQVLSAGAQATPDTAGTSPGANGVVPDSISHIYGETTFGFTSQELPK